MIGGALLFVPTPRARVIPLVATDYVYALPHVPARVHYFARYLMVIVKIRTL